MLKGKKILIGITGSIAAYKIPILVRLLVKAGADVKIVMTPAAKNFVSPLTLATLSKNPVLSDLSEGEVWANHVMLGRWADIMLIAPLSCNTLAKMSTGACDNLLLAVYLSATCPVLLAPAMDEDMWLHPATKSNLKQLQSYGNMILPVGNGELASGLKGEGRMTEPENISEWIHYFFMKTKELAGTRSLVTAGPTMESIDPVRFISNHSTGKMGLAIAEELLRRGSAVTLVLGPSDLEIAPGIQVIKVTTAEEMFNVCMTQFAQSDIAVMSAAVADYTPVEVASQKIKKNEENFSLAFKRTKDILKHLGNSKSAKQVLVGFALETNDEKANAQKKLKEKNADLIILNSLNEQGAGFGYDSNKITIFDRNGAVNNFELKSKKEVAVDIVNAIIQFKK